MEEKNKDWTIITLLNTCADYLKEKNIDAPRTNTELLLCHTLGVKRLELYLHHDRPVSDEELQKFRELVARRINHEPIQYIVGETEFMSIPFIVTPDVLIPRPETEILVEKAIKLIETSRGDSEEIKIIDIGTGSGNIAISLARYLKNANIMAIDVSSKAINVARKNAEMNRVSEKITFLEKSIFDCENSEFNNFDLIISNPPYVSPYEYNHLMPEVRKYEPESALIDTGNELIFYKTISSLAEHWLADKGNMIFEIGINMGEKVFQILEDKCYKNIEIFHDYSKIERVISCSKNIE